MENVLDYNAIKAQIENELRVRADQQKELEVLKSNHQKTEAAIEDLETRITKLIAKSERSSSDDAINSQIHSLKIKKTSAEQQRAGYIAEAKTMCKEFGISLDVDSQVLTPQARENCLWQLLDNHFLESPKLAEIMAALIKPESVKS